MKEKETRLSLCTVCMNRLDSLKKTLPNNIESDRGNANEFVLLDYNSQDGLEKWVKAKMMAYIEKGQLNFYQMLDPVPQFFSHAHSRNLACLLAEGNILCNVDADYHLEEGFFSRALSQAKEGQALVPDYSKVETENYGFNCLKKDDFMRIRGYDERFVNHGCEDIDLCFRLIQSGVQVNKVPQRFKMKLESHDNLERIKNTYDYHNICDIYLSKNAESMTKIVFLFKDGKVEMGSLIKSHFHVPFLLEKRWMKGQWKKQNKSILVNIDNVEFDLNCKKKHFKPIIEDAIRVEVILLKSHILTHQMLRERKESRDYQVNPTGFGKGKVKKNFVEEIVVTA